MCSINSKILCDEENCKICYERSFASHEKAKYWSNKNNENPRNMFKCSGKKFLFECECGHTFSKILEEINRGRWCPYCSNKQLCGDEKCQKCFEKSFANYEKSKYWSNKNLLKPYQVFKCSNNKFLFDCPICSHEFESTLDHIIGGLWCPYCTIGGNKKLCDDNNCNTCFEKSFASLEKSKYWSNKNNIDSRKCLKNSNNKYIFDCQICFHEFKTTLAKITSNKRWCSFCTNQKLCTNDDCKFCYEKSFSSHPKSNYWSEKNKIKPRMCFKQSHKKYIFDCPFCHNEYVSNLTNIYKGKWCNCTINKTETKLYDFLNNNFDIKIEKQKLLTGVKI